MKKLALATIITASITSTAHAYDTSAIVVGIGAHQAFDESVIGGKLERRGGDFDNIPNLSPMAGFEANADGALYGYAGILYDWRVAEKIAIVPSFAAGLYEEGDGKDLGGTFNFRSTLEVDYLLTPNSRAGISISHKSNASIYDQNPGTEEILAVYSFGY